MNGLVYGPVSTMAKPIFDSHTVPQKAMYRDGVMSGGEENALVNSRLVMYDNDQQKSMNPIGSIKMVYPKMDGPLSGANLDPVLNQSQKIADRFLHPAQTNSPSKTVYNFL